MFVVEIPTNAPIARIDDDDVMFATMDAKFKAIAKDIAERHKKGQPVLVGTISIETSELLSNLLKKRGIPHNVLNAKQHEREAEIVAKAGEKGAVTIATNMAGRGTDIKLGEGVVELGGLAVIGTERHESRRIDNQLRGRSGRQGDPGYSCFYLSAEDDLLKRFGSDRFKMIVNMGTRNEKDEEGNDLPLQMKVLSKFIEGAQRKVEGMNFDNRKSVVEYDEVLRKQREVIYKQRNDILFLEDMEPVVLKMMDSVVTRRVPLYYTIDHKTEIFDNEHFVKEFVRMFFNLTNVEEDEFDGKSLAELQQYVLNKFHEGLNEKKEIVPLEQFREFLKVVLLRVIDRHWMEHIDQMSSLRQSIRLQSYAQLNPLREYQEIGFEMFNNMIASIEDEVVQLINRAQVQQNLQREEVAKPTGTSGGSDDTTKRKPVKAGEKVGRNDPCPCGSGRKYKHCCGQK
jgi:preprotein translocase subunit SecA